MTIKFPKRLHDEEDFIHQEKANNLFYSKKKKIIRNNKKLPVM